MRTKSKWRWLWGLAAVSLLLVGVFAFWPALSGETATLPPQAVAAVAPAAPVAHPALSAAAATAHTTQLSASGDETISDSVLVADTPSSDNCVACHTDKALLQEIAEEPEEVKSELAAGEG